jgi:hypothetical protein
MPEGTVRLPDRDLSRELIFCDLGKTVQLGRDEPEDEDLSIDCLVADFVELLQVMFPEPTKAPSLLVRSLVLNM